MANVAYVLVQIAVQLPILVVLAVGLVLLLARRSVLPSRAMGLGTAGCVVLLGGVIVNTVWTINLPVLIRDEQLTTQNIALLASLVGLLSTAAFATGIGLLVAAVLAGRRPEAPPYAPPSSAVSSTAGP